MRSKFKDYLLYTLSTIGLVALFISATTLPPQSSTVPESHEWELIMSVTSTDAYIYNKKTGETWGMRRQELGDKWAKIQQIK